MSYALKVISRQRQSGFVVENFGGDLFKTKEEIRDKITCTLKTKNYITESDELQFGFIIPGHGFKGKQHALEDCDDITEMYEFYKGKKPPIILWVKIKAVAGRARKRLSELSESIEDKINDATKKQKVSNSKDPIPRRSSYQNHLSKMAEVDAIVGELEEKHSGGKFSPEQIRAWAHMLHLKKHVSYDEPPNKPFFNSKGSASAPTA